MARRAGAQFEGLARDFARRQREEEERVEGIFDQLAATLRQALAGGPGSLLGGPLGPGARQLSFDDLDATERQQLERDRRAWQERLDANVDERRRELEALGRRFAGVRNLVFPFAVAVCSPERPR